MSRSASLRLVQSPTREIQPTRTELEITIKEYLAAIRQSGHSAATLEKYEYHLGRLAGWLNERGVTRPEQTDKRLLREWGASLHENWSPATVKLAVSVARSFFSWCREESIIDEPLGSALRLPKVKRRIQRTLSSTEVQRLLSACDQQTTKGKRDLAIISLMVDSGLRASELCKIEVEDSFFDVPLLGTSVNFVVVLGKGGHEDVAYFGDTTAARLKAWLAVRPNWPQVRKLFVSVGGNTPCRALTRYGLRDILRKTGRRAGVERVTPHSLRRSFAMIADEAGASTLKIQQWGRWSDIKMVERYTQALKAGRHYKQYSPVDFLSRTE